MKTLYTTLKDMEMFIQERGFRTGYSTKKDTFLILSKGYQLLGEIYYRRQCDVRLNGHFDRIKEVVIKQLIVEEITRFIRTPIEKRNID